MKKRIADDVISRIPAPRFATYLAETDSGQGPNPYTALDLYLWNIEAAAAVTSTTSIVEVALRDCIDQQLRIWNQEKIGTKDWITKPAVPLSHIVRSTPPRSWRPTTKRPLYKYWWETKARERRTKDNPNHDDLVAALSFGTWLQLIPKPPSLNGQRSGPRVDLWEDALSQGFKASAYQAYTWAETLRQARNRASHLEPLLNLQQLRHWHRVSSRLLNSLWPEAHVLVSGPARIPRVIQRYPLVTGS